MAKVYFPTNGMLEEATMKVLQNLGGTATTKIINQGVAEMLQLSDDVLTIEDETGCGTKYQVRMRWTRTTMKNKGLIKNTAKATWSIAE